MNLISAYVDGELTGVEMLEIRRHLSDCMECSEEYESLRMTKLAVSRLRTVAPRPEFAAELLQKLDVVRIPAHQRLLSRIYNYSRKKLSPVAAALAASGVALAILSAGGGDRVITENAGVVASSPLDLRVQSVSYMPQVPNSPIIYSDNKPLVVANETREPSLQLASLSFK